MCDQSTARPRRAASARSTTINPSLPGAHSLTTGRDPNAGSARYPRGVSQALTSLRTTKTIKDTGKMMQKNVYEKSEGPESYKLCEPRLVDLFAEGSKANLVATSHKVKISDAQ